MHTPARGGGGCILERLKFSPNLLPLLFLLFPLLFVLTLLIALTFAVKSIQVKIDYLDIKEFTHEVIHRLGCCLYCTLGAAGARGLLDHFAAVGEAAGAGKGADADGTAA